MIYCSNIQNALSHVFRQLIIENCKDEKYGASLNELSDAISNAEQEFDDLLTPKILRKLDK